MLYLKNVNITVTEYNKESMDWSSETFDKGCFDFDTQLKNDSIDEIKKAINDSVYSMLQPNEIMIDINDGFVHYSQPENGNGDYDENGSYLVDYDFIIVKKENYTNLSDGTF